MNEQVKRPELAIQSRKGISGLFFYGLLLASLFVVACYLLLPAFQTTRKRPMSSCQRNLKMIGLALQAYHDDFGSFPPAVVRSREGKRLHSWRVLILPYLADLHENDANWLRTHRYDFGFWESHDFHAREKTARRKAEQIRIVLADYDFKEPWNGPNNQQFADLSLEAFCCHHGRNDSNTDYVAVVGIQTAWPENKTTLLKEFSDGSSNTILVVESIDSGIHWAEPRDLQFEKMSFVIGDQTGFALMGPFPNAANVLFADGCVSSLSANIGEDVLRALLTIGGRESIDSW